MRKIVFFGAGDFVIPVIEVLKDNGLVLVITTETDGKVIDYLKLNNIEYISSRFLEDSTKKALEKIQPDFGVLASFGAIIPKKIINIFQLGIINIHPSLLPKFKGPAPVPYTITAGEKETGVTIIQMDEELDHGPIISQKTIKLEGNETSEELLELLFSESTQMVKQIVQDVNKGLEIKSKPQSKNNESWTEKLKKEDGKIDLKNPPDPKELDRKIRAFYPWPGVYLTVSLSGKEKKLKLLPQRKQGKSKATLPQQVQVEGKNPMSYKDFINGYSEGYSILQQLNLVN